MVLRVLGSRYKSFEKNNKGKLWSIVAGAGWRFIAYIYVALESKIQVKSIKSS